MGVGGGVGGWGGGGGSGGGMGGGCRRRFHSSYVTVETFKIESFRLNLLKLIKC